MTDLGPGGGATPANIVDDAASLLDINAFMDRFHQIEAQLGLFDDLIDGEPWWDRVRFDACYYLYDCVSGLTYSSAHKPPPQRRMLGIVRRLSKRLWLLVRAGFMRNRVLVLRARRQIVAGARCDMVLDPIIALVQGSKLVIDTMPTRYHLPEPPRRQASSDRPVKLTRTVAALLDAFAIVPERAAKLSELIDQGLATFASDMAGYDRLFAAARPRMVLVPTSDKPLCAVARRYGVPVLEAQHGLIGYGHPAYSYSRSLDYADQPGFPDAFMVFSEFWRANGYYPAGDTAVIGTDQLVSTTVPQLVNGLGAVMIISADIYHETLAALTLDIATHLPGRRVIYKLHPNQHAQEDAIRLFFANCPNVTIGSALAPAAQSLADVSHLVAIQSTVVYEALHYGLAVCLIARFDYHLHSDVFDQEGVSVTGTLEELLTALGRPAVHRADRLFFEPFQPRRVVALLERFADAGDRS